MMLLESLSESYQTRVLTPWTKEHSALTIEVTTAQIQQEELQHQRSGLSLEAALLVTEINKLHNHSHGNSKSTFGINDSDTCASPT